MTRENELQDLRLEAENEISRLHFTLGYYIRTYGEVINEKNTEEEKLYYYCNTMKHILMDSYEKLVKIQSGVDKVCREEEEKNP